MEGIQGQCVDFADTLVPFGVGIGYILCSGIGEDWYCVDERPRERQEGVANGRVKTITEYLRATDDCLQGLVNIDAVVYVDVAQCIHECAIYPPLVSTPCDRQ